MRGITICALIASTAFAATAATAAAAGDGKSSAWIRVQQLPIGGSMAHGGSSAQAGKEKWIEIQGWDWGGTQAGDPDRPLVAGRIPNASSTGSGANETLTVGGDRTETAQATGKRQHMPLRTRMYYDAPLPRGSVRVKVKMPWLGCQVGAAYPRLELGGGGKSYVLEDVTVASCAGGSLPMEEISFNYGKITTVYNQQDKTAPKTKVRGWDPDKKEQ